MARWWAPLVALLVVVPATLFAAAFLTRPDPLPPEREPIVLQQDTSPSPEPSRKPAEQKEGNKQGAKPSKNSVEGAVLDPDDLDDDDDDDGRDDDDWDDDDDDDD